MSKRNNKGFTLIEILATIAIIAVVTLIATVTYTKVRRNIVNRQYKNLKAIIEIAGVRYTSKTGKTWYFVRELIEQGYLDPDDETGNIYDPRDDHSLNCHLIQVDVDNVNYTATLGDINYVGKNGCELNCPNDPCPIDPDPDWELTLKAFIHGKDKNYLTAPSDESKVLSKDSVNIYKNVDIIISGGLRWTNKQLDLTAELNSNLPYYVDTTGVKYIWNNDASTVGTSNTHTTSVEVLYNNPYYVEAVMKNDKHSTAYIHYSFDEQPPVIKKGSPSYLNNDKDVWKKYKYITFEITENGVGLERVYIGKRPCSDMKKDKKLGAKVANPNSHVQSFKVEEETGKDGENGEVNICGIDKLGNVSVEEPFKVIKIDITPPHCTKNLKAKRSDDVIGEHNKYQYADRTIRQYCYDNNMINGTLVHGSECDPSESYGHSDGSGHVYFQKTFGKDGAAIKVGYITIYDKVGWQTKCPVDVYVDRKGPLCAKKTGNTSIGQTKNGGSSSTDGATTTGVGSVNNWDQNFRHITQYCYDENVGCRSDNNPSKSQEWDYNDDKIIRTRKIRLYDKVPECSRRETQITATADCAGSNWNSAENKTKHNNHTDCTVGVFIDHLKPEVTRESGLHVHSGNRIRFSCSDPSWNDSLGNTVQGSGVLSFRAKTTTDSNLISINPCENGANDCSTSNGPWINNTNGHTLHFKINHSVGTATSIDINTETVCEDHAHNIEYHDSDHSNPFVTDTAISYTDDNSYVKENFQGKKIGPCGNCHLRRYRPAMGYNCAQFSYECQCQDQACSSPNNDGEGVTCCLGGADPVYGCKKHDTTLTHFNTKLENAVYPHAAANITYMSTNNKLYVAPDTGSADYDVYCDAGGCTAGYECKVFNCYPDNAYGESYRYYTVCGNYTE